MPPLLQVDAAVGGCVHPIAYKAPLASAEQDQDISRRRGETPVAPLAKTGHDQHQIVIHRLAYVAHVHRFALPH